jgi:hypothetical protein
VKESGPRYSAAVSIPVPYQLPKGAGLYICMGIINRVEGLKDVQ